MGAALFYSVATGVFTIIGFSEAGFSAVRFMVTASPPRRRAATTNALKVAMLGLLSLGNPLPRVLSFWIEAIPNVNQTLIK